MVRTLLWNSETSYEVTAASLEGSDELTAKEFWAEGLEIPFSNFTKTWFKPRGTKNSHPNGICRLSVSSKSLMEAIRSDVHLEFQS